MSGTPKQNAISQLERLVAAQKRLHTMGAEDPGRFEAIVTFIAAVKAAVFRIAGANSPYAEEVQRAIGRSGYESRKVPYLVGIVKAMLDDVTNDNLQCIAALHHAELFADYLDMADHLLAEGYKDPAAVVAGSSLEAHLRLLASVNGIETVNAAGKAKKADLLNAELVAADVFNKLDQKHVTAWLDLRNKAAHGHYSEYSSDQVALLIGGVKGFLARNPA